MYLFVYVFVLSFVHVLLWFYQKNVFFWATRKTWKMQPSGHLGTTKNGQHWLGWSLQDLGESTELLCKDVPKKNTMQNIMVYLIDSYRFISYLLPFIFHHLLSSSTIFYHVCRMGAVGILQRDPTAVLAHQVTSALHFETLAHLRSSLEDWIFNEFHCSAMVHGGAYRCLLMLADACCWCLD